MFSFWTWSQLTSVDGVLAAVLIKELGPVCMRFLFRLSLHNSMKNTAGMPIGCGKRGWLLLGFLQAQQPTELQRTYVYARKYRRNHLQTWTFLDDKFSDRHTTMRRPA